MKKNKKLKSILGKLVLCLVCALCCVTGKETTAYANWTCECSNPENADYDSKCWKCNKYRNMRPVFDTETDKEFDYGDNVKLRWTGKVGSQGYILAVRNLDTDYRPFYNMELGMYEDSYTIREDLPSGKYKAAVAAIDVYGKEYWCEECIYFYVNPEPVAEQEYEEITSTPVIDDGEEEWCVSWEASESEEIVVTPEETELGVGGDVTDDWSSDKDEYVKSDLDVFEYSSESVITDTMDDTTNTTANTTTNADVSATEETTMDAGSWFDWFVRWYEDNVVNKSATQQSTVPEVEENVSTPTPVPYETMVEESISQALPTPTNKPVEDIDDTEHEEIGIDELIPAEFKIKSPKDGKIYKVGKNVTIKWKASERADKYEVRLINEDTGKKVKSVTTTAKSYKFKGNTLEEGNYSVSIKACNDYGAIECEALRFSVTKSGKSTFTVTSSDIEVAAGDSVASDIALKMTMSSDVSSYSVTLVSNTLNKTVYSLKNCKGNTCEISKNYLYPGNDYTLTVESKTGKDGKTPRTDKLSFKVALDYSKIGQEGKFQAPITKDSNCIITVNKNEYLETSREAYVKQLAANIEYLISRAEANNAFTEVQIQCLRDIYGRQLDRKEGENYVLLSNDMNEYLEFRYEGSGKGSGTLYGQNVAGQADVSNKNANPDADSNIEFGTFSAMTVVIKNAEIQGIFMRTSTLPDNYLHYIYPVDKPTYTGVLKAGVYNLVKWNHDSFAAFQVRDDDKFVPAIYDEVTWNDDLTSNGINVHHNYGGEEVKRFSAGCLTVHKQDWKSYMKVYGLNGNYTKCWASGLGDKVGQIVIERLIDIEINAHGKTFRQDATFPVTQK